MASGSDSAPQISAIREFNRFYTARLGLLRKRHLDGQFSLTEARLLYEIFARPGITASALCVSLELDPGYLSRLLTTLARRKLLNHSPSILDGREKLLNLTALGQKAVAKLNEQSDRHVAQIISTLSPADRVSLLSAITQVRQLLSVAPEVRIVRLTEPSSDAQRILEEYYEAVHVVKRDSPGALQSLLAEPTSAMWVATLGSEVVGCVVLRELPSLPRAGECKRLYVRPAARGRHVGSLLLDALEEHARNLKLDWIYLDTYDDLKRAISLYEQRGYEPCERYNDNPQATLFMRKRL